jgi:hypothetical protein
MEVRSMAARELLAALVATIGLALPAGARPLGAGDEAEQSKAIAKVERALADDKAGAAGVSDALDELRPFDSAAVAELLVKAFTQLELRAIQIDKSAHDAVERGKISENDITVRRREVDPIRRAQGLVLGRVKALRSEAALVWLIDHVIGDDRFPLSFKVEAMTSAGQGGRAMVEPLRKALARSKRPDDMVPVLMATQSLEKLAQPLADAIVPLVDHAEPTVRENAALALARLAAPQGVEPLVKRIDQETGKTQLRIAAALEILTRQKLGLSGSAWKNWFAAEGIRYTSGQAELGGGEAAVTKQATGYFHGIAQDSHSIVYVVDISGSMIVSMTHPRFEQLPNGMRPIPAPEGEESRMTCSKKELVKALGDLPDGTMFDIVYFAAKAERYSPKLLEANPASIKKAQKWVEALEPVGATNIYDAMESAFGLAGRGANDKYYGSVVDTIFLLTDGKPFLTSGPDSTDRILELVRRSNPMKRITIHTIGLGTDIEVDFLRSMATENSGVFVQK